MTHAVIETGGKQYRVAPGDVIAIECIKDTSAGSDISFSALFVEGDDLGVSKKVVKGTVLEETFDTKKVGIKYKPKSRYRVKYGHRQPIIKVKIESIG